MAPASSLVDLVLQGFFCIAVILLHVAFNLNYFNTATNKELRLLMKFLDKHYTEEKSVRITWFYEEGDEDMEDIGKGYSVSLSVPVSVEAV